MFGIFKDVINHLEYNADQLNQELTSINQELTSINQELTSINQELTSINQELTSINQELTSRVERLEKELAFSKNVDKEWKEGKTKEPKTQTEDKEGDKEEQK